MSNRFLDAEISSNLKKEKENEPKKRSTETFPKGGCQIDRVKKNSHMSKDRKIVV